MTGVIRLLPDSIANQIAAGEVIQRPASVVKELLENSVDAGADEISLIVKDAGRTLVQVIDNGSGMSETDARMSLERHATSKISSSDDLFRLRTLGFRGEALASIVAVAQVELKTRTREDETGTLLEIASSKVLRQEVVAAPPGTSIAVKNLFYNVPARRKFLKSDAVEMRHIIDEFQRIALVNPQVTFKMYKDGQLLFHLHPSQLRQRITSIFGKNYEEKLVPLEEETDIVKLQGFIGKPDTARKSRGEQFLFVNGRYFKSPYFHAAISQAFEGLLPHGYHPSYFVFFEVNPEFIDVNIHPTKTEIKFQDERTVYAILRSAVKRSIGQYHVSPSLDFENDPSLDIPPPPAGAKAERPGVFVNPSYNPFDTHSTRSAKVDSDWARGRSLTKSSAKGWETLYEAMNKEAEAVEPQQQNAPLQVEEGDTLVRQIGNKYVLVQASEGIFLIHQYRAHTRILYEQFEAALSSGKPIVQKLLFPETVEVSTQDIELLNEIVPDLCNVGFEIEPFGKNTYIVHGVPPGCEQNEAEQIISGMLDAMRENRPADGDDYRDKLLASVARQSAIKSGQELKAQEMIALYGQLMRCKQPQLDLNGKKTFIIVNGAMLDKMFNS